jgi:hypothetical protein
VKKTGAKAEAPTAKPPAKKTAKAKPAIDIEDEEEEPPFDVTPAAKTKKAPVKTAAVQKAAAKKAPVKKAAAKKPPTKAKRA